MRRHQDIITGRSEGVWSYFIRNGKVALLAGVLIMVWGIGAVLTIPKESAPYIPFGIVNIGTAYTGASATDVDDLITSEIESKIKNVSGINSYDSVSQDGFSNVTIEFEPETDMLKAVSDLRSKVDEAKGGLPSDLENDPSITEIDSSLESFLSIVIHGEVAQLELTDYAEKLKLQLENITDVARVSLSGDTQREYAVQVDQQQLEGLGLTLSDVTNALRANNSDTPLGDFTIDQYDYALRLSGKVFSINEIENITMRNLGTALEPQLIRLSDVAQVTERGEDTGTISRFWTQETGQEDFYDAVTINLSRRGESDLFAVTGRAKKVVEEFRETLPNNVLVSTVSDSTIQMSDSYENVIRSGVQAVIIVMLLIFIFVGVKEGLTASLVIPLTFLATIGALSFFDKTLNFMTNFSMVLALGILVDTAIVVTEGVHHFIKKGYSGKEAALLSLHEFKGPLIAGWLTTIVVFLPLFSLPGVLGLYLQFIPITVTIVLTLSVIISLFLLPSYASYLLAPRAQPEGECAEKRATWSRRIRAAIDQRIQWLISSYDRVLEYILETRRQRLGALAAVIAAFFLSMQISVPFVMFPSDDFDFVNVEIELPQGAQPENVAVVALEAEQILLGYEEVKHITNSVSGNFANINVELIGTNDRKAAKMLTSQDLETAWQERFDQITGGNVSVQSLQNGPPSESPVAFRVVVQDQNNLPIARSVTEELTTMLRQIPGTNGVKNNIEEIPGEVRFRIDRAQAAALGVNTSSIGSILRTAINGTTATTITRDQRDIDVIVEIAEQDLTNISDVLQLAVTANDGTKIRLSEILTVENQDALAKIRRQDGNLAFTISSLLTEDGNAAAITEEFLAELAEYQMPAGVELLDAGENEENAELFAALTSAMIIAILLMFTVLVVIFDSFSQPLLILFALLFAQIGVNVGLYLTGSPQGLPSILGIIALFGVVVNDAIIMVDQMNKNSHETGRQIGQGLLRGIRRAGVSRFTPVVLTTLTTSAGILPLVFIDAFWAAMSWTLIFGLMVASTMTLFLTPALFAQFRNEFGSTMLFFVSTVLITMGAISVLLQLDFSGFIFIAVGALLLYLCRRLWRRNDRKNSSPQTGETEQMLAQ